MKGARSRRSKSSIIPAWRKTKSTASLCEAAARWPIEGIVAIHRYGLIRPGEPIVLAVTASTHRAEAFAAASFLMDYLKTEAPFWKKQHLADQASGDWVEAKAQDQAAAQKWRA